MRALIVSIVFLVHGVAFADVIGIPPSCPEHSTPIECHGPDTCAPERCASDTECGPGRACGTINLCTSEHCCMGGWVGGCGDPSVTQTHVAGPCAADGSCAEAGTSCTAQRVCIDMPGVDAGHSDADAGRVVTTYGGCCSIAGAPGTAGGALFALAIAMMLRRRRRPR